MLRQQRARQTARVPDGLSALFALVVVDLLLFLGGMSTHSGIGIPLGPVLWIKPGVVPAAIIEGVGGIGLAATVASVASRAVWADRLTWWVMWYCFAGVMWGIAAPGNRVHP